ncbi:MAG: hypothetical protein DI527_16490 [Chelatococcus sp.]|nr:MAG: hypothetical protein DI527_16490 [Chelatococcus sp.]
MAASEYPLTAADWTNCGPADDCTIQTVAAGTVIITFAAAKPDAGTKAGLRIGIGPNLQRDAGIQEAGKTLWARTLRGSNTLTVER